MKRFQSYRFRLKTTSRVDALFSRFAGSCRYVYNRAIATNEKLRDGGGKRLTYAAMCKRLTTWRNDEETSWLAESSAVAQQQALRNLERAYVNFFEGRAAAPKFKKKGKSLDSFRLSAQKCRINSATGRIMLPNIGWVRFFNSRTVEGVVKNVGVVRCSGKWFVSIQTEREVPNPIHPKTGSAIGIDMGVVSIVTLSTGEQVPPLNAFRAIQSKLTKVQRAMARKVKFSSNWKKQNLKVRKLYKKATNRRADYLHKLSNTISKNHALVVVEDLQVKKMTASASGTIEKPGTNVRQKSLLNKAILDQGWSELVRQLEYKAEWRGGKLVKVNPAYTSQTCSKCGHCEIGNRPSQSRFTCVSCNLDVNADVNAASVILAAGQAVFACGAAN